MVVFIFLNCVSRQEHEEVMLIISDSYCLFLLSITTYRNPGQARNQSGRKCVKI